MRRIKSEPTYLGVTGGQPGRNPDETLRIAKPIAGVGAQHQKLVVRGGGRDYRSKRR